MHRIGDYVAVILLVLTGASSAAAGDTGFSFRAGVGYDLLSQEFSLDTTLDTLSTALALNTTYLDDIRGQLTVRYLPYDDRRLDLQTTLEQSSDLYRVRFYGDYRADWERFELNLKAESDWRESTADVPEAGESFLYGFGQARLGYKMSGSSTLRAELRGDFVTFDSITTFAYNHHRIGGKVGVESYVAGFSVLTGEVFLLSRQVPDSLQLNYLSLGANGSFFGIWERGRTDVYVRFERRDYDQPRDEDDFTRIEIDADNKLGFSKALFTRQLGRIEVTSFSPDDLLNADYYRLGLAVLGGWENSRVSLGLGPEIEWLQEEEVEFGESGSYVETGVRTILDYTSVPGFLGSVESRLGYRNLKEESDLQSSFVYERLNVLADLSLWQALSLNMLLSAEWEWHDQHGESSQLFLLSSGLNYAF